MSDKLTLNMVVSNAMEALEFYEKVFNAKRGDMFFFPNKTGENEANIVVGNVELRLVDENAAYHCHPPQKGEVDSIWLQIIVDDMEVVLKKAKENGAVVGQETSEFMGTRHAEITDPFGYTWTINQILREVSYKERYETYLKLQEEAEE
ncbi:MAG: VOC family protein [Candidatus Limiplasma sp.]|nr:VOC family protein [Candidatus Limiplasma sp.]